MPDKQSVPSKPLWQAAVNYGEIGVTRADDLVDHPPRGYRVYERRSRVGHGEARWEHAWQTVLTWGMQRGAGLSVKLIEAPPHVTEGTYQPVVFDTGGMPVVSSTRSEEGDVLYGPQGEPFISPGDTAILGLKVGPFHFDAPCRVIYVIDERDRRGFAYGTLDGHPETGEAAFIVDRTDDGSVWLTIRSFSRPGTLLTWLGYPVARLMQSRVNERYFRSLSGPLG